MPYFTLNIADKIEMNSFETEAEARSYCRKRHYPILIIFEGKFDDVFEVDYRYGPPIAVYVHGKGYNAVPVEKDVPYTTYRVIPERLPSAPGFGVIIVGEERYGELQDKIDAFFEAGGRLLWVIYSDSRSIEVYTPDRKHFQWLRDRDTLHGGDVMPGFSLPVQDLFEEVVVE